MNGWLIALGLLIAIGLFPVGISLTYQASGAGAQLLVGPVHLALYPRKTKKRRRSVSAPPKPEGEKRQAESTGKQEPPIPDGPPPGAPTKKLEKPARGGGLTDFLPLIEIGLDALAGLRLRLRVRLLRLRLVLAGDDPADLAVNYGRAQASVAALLAQLHRFVVIRREDVSVSCDFAGERTTVLARLDVTITLGRALCWAVRYGWSALRGYLKIKKQQE